MNYLIAILMIPVIMLMALVIVTALFLMKTNEVLEMFDSKEDI